MTIATLPPSVHIRALRTLLDRLRRHQNTAYGLPTRAELDHANDSLNELEAQIKQLKGSLL